MNVTRTTQSICCSLVLILGHLQPVFSEILPAEVLGDWSDVGVEGGIPDYPVGVNAKDSPYNAVGDGVVDDTQALLDAIAACPEGQAVFLPAGSYLTTGTIIILKSIAVRGAGPDATTIIHDHGSPGMQIGPNDPQLPMGVERAGIEDLHLSTRYPYVTTGGTRLYVNNATNSWVRNIKTSGHAYQGIEVNACTHCEIRDNFINNTYEYSPWQVESYGIRIAGYNLNGYAGIGTYNLVENNVLDNLGCAILAQEHTVNNVFAYNFSWNNISVTHDFKLHHPDYDDPTRITTFLLAEGNSFEMADHSTWHRTNTFLRNRGAGGHLMTGITVHDGNFAIGNELPAHKHPDLGTENLLQAFGDSIAHGNYITDGSSSYTPPTYGGGLQWDPSISDQDIPDSYYLTSKPEFFGDLDWPCFGGDLMPNNKRRSPAEVRYWTMLFPENQPANLQANVDGNDVVLTWSHTPFQAGSTMDFVICRSANGVDFDRIGTASGSIFTDTVTTGGAYTYYVRARNHLGGMSGDDLGGESDPSNTVSATVLGIPTPPAGLAITTDR